MIEDPDRCYAALGARDPRYDGWFVVAVTSTGIYCRPSCPARTPRRDNVRFYATAAAAQNVGFRACKRCRPDASPGSPAWDQRADVVGRAMRLIGDGVVDREGVGGLASRLGYSSRHVHRQLVAEVGAGPLALSRAQRAQTARTLIERTELPFTEVAYAAGFRSLRQFNDTVRQVYDLTPTALRTRARRGAVVHGETIVLRLAARLPVAVGPMVSHLRARLIEGMEAWTTEGSYLRALGLPRGGGSAELTVHDDHVMARLNLADVRDLAAAVHRCRRMLDLDADPVAVDAHLAEDRTLRTMVAARPGLRVPGYPDPFEAAVRTILGQQVSLAGARRSWARLVERAGGELPGALGDVRRRFPTADEVAASDLSGLGLTGQRERTLRTLAEAVADGRISLHVGADRAELRQVLLAVPGIGPWSVEEVALRGLGDPDAFPATDLVLGQAAKRLGLAWNASDLDARAEGWRPWRAYAAQHLWTDVAVAAQAA